MTAVEDRERAALIDLSRAMSSAEAMRLLEATLAESRLLLPPGGKVDIHTGDLLLTPGVLLKIRAAIASLGLEIETLYSDVPQTQQSALDEGLFVRRFPPRNKPYQTPVTPHTAGISSLAAFTAESVRDLDLPFESRAAITETHGLSHLSITKDDGTREQLDNLYQSGLETIFYRQTLRSGQVLEAKGNIVIIGDAHSGSEILADGDIVIWGFLGGIAHAGRSGSVTSEIRAMRIEAVQLRIANAIARRPDRLFKALRKHKGPEVAKIKNGEIQIFEDNIER